MKLEMTRKILTCLKCPKYGEAYDVTSTIIESLVSTDFYYSVQKITRESSTPEAYVYGYHELPTVVGLKMYLFIKTNV